MRVKEYELPNKRKVVFEFDENGVGKIRLEAMDRLMEMIGAKEIYLVRCGECKWWNEETHGCNRNPCVKAWWETDHCSYGERK